MWTEKKKHYFRFYRKIGYSFIGAYVLAAVVFLIFLARLDMVPALYLALLGGVLLLLGGLFCLMQKRKTSSIIADVLCVVLVLGNIFASVYIDKMVSTIREVSSVSLTADEIGVYVLQDDPAQELSDAADYQFAMAMAINRENTDKAVEDIEKKLGKTLEVKEYGDVYSLLDSLKQQESGAVIINSQYIGIAQEAGNYAWVKDGVRQIASFVYEEKKAESLKPVTAEKNNSFVMYLSGIDTYGDIFTKSRSDVNILAVVNPDTKNILLLSTPRDYYISHSATGGAKDKLTHAGIYGVEASINALEQLYDVGVNYYLRVNFTGFTQIIDALGGIDVYSQYDFTAGGKQFAQGYNHLNGEQALAFSRERYSFEDGDFQRGRNQMEVIRGVIQKAASSALLTNYMSVMDAVAGSFETNMPQEKIGELVKMQLADMASWKIETYSASGQVSTAETFSAPGEMLSVVIPDENSIEEAKNLINSVMRN